MQRDSTSRRDTCRGTPLREGLTQRDSTSRRDSLREGLLQRKSVTCNL
jgi:hypothetical protein